MRYPLLTTTAIMSAVEEHNARLVRRLGALSFAIILVGTLGFMLFEHANASDAFYSTLIILMTHYGEQNYTDPAGRILFITLVLASFLLIAYLLKWFAEYMMGLTGNVRKLRVKSKVDKLKDHYIICGLGRVGSQVAGEMVHEGVDFVALDRDEAKVAEGFEKGYL